MQSELDTHDLLDLFEQIRDAADAVAAHPDALLSTGTVDRDRLPKIREKLAAAVLVLQYWQHVLDAATVPTRDLTAHEFNDLVEMYRVVFRDRIPRWRSGSLDSAVAPGDVVRNLARIFDDDDDEIYLYPGEHLLLCRAELYLDDVEQHQNVNQTSKISDDDKPTYTTVSPERSLINIVDVDLLPNPHRH